MDPVQLLSNLAVAAITAAGVLIPTLLTGRRENRARTTPTYDRLATQITDLWARMDHQTSTIDTLADRVALLERRDDAWQRGWDHLREGWPEVRQRPDPPPYPTSRLN